MELKLFNFTHPLACSDWPSLLSDKYVHALPFSWKMVRTPKEANVIVWDGVITPKNEKLIQEFTEEKVLLIMGESMTLLEKNKLVKTIDVSQRDYVELPGWNSLPEEILGALTECHKKLNHV